MIQEIWATAETQAASDGVSVRDRYVELLEAKIETLALLREATTKKVSDAIMACSAIPLLAKRDDQLHEMSRKLLSLVGTILATSEKEVADDIVKQRVAYSRLKRELFGFLADHGFGGAQILTTSEIIDALTRLVDKKGSGNAEKSSPPAGA